MRYGTRESTGKYLATYYYIITYYMLFIFNAVYGLAPPYISETLRLYQSGRALRSAGQHLLEVPRSRYKQWGDRFFAVAGPKSWNTLPSDLRTTTDLPQFKANLKTYLFELAFH